MGFLSIRIRKNRDCLVPGLSDDVINVLTPLGSNVSIKNPDEVEVSRGKRFTYQKVSELNSGDVKVAPEGHVGALLELSAERIRTFVQVFDNKPSVPNG